MFWGFILGCYAAGAACISFASLAVCRTLLDVFKSCMAPILVLIIVMWYKKDEQGLHVSWFYVCNPLTQIFDGFLPYGVSFAKTKFACRRIFFCGNWGYEHAHWSYNLHIIAQLAGKREEVLRYRKACCAAENEGQSVQNAECALEESPGTFPLFFKP
jgi:hypothetical protein